MGLQISAISRYPFPLALVPIGAGNFLGRKGIGLQKKVRIATPS